MKLLSGRCLHTLLGILALAVCGSTVLPQAPAPPPGTVVLHDLPVPLSNLLSLEAQAYVRHLIVDQPFAAGAGLTDFAAQRAFEDKLLSEWLAPMRARYPVSR